MAGDRAAGGGPHRERHPHPAAGRFDGGCHAGAAPRPGVRAAAGHGPRRRSARSPHRVVAAHVGERRRADGDCLESGAGGCGAGAGDVGGAGRGKTGEDGEPRGAGRCAFPVFPRPSPSFPIASLARDLILLPPPHARDALDPAIPAARRVDGGGAVAVGRAARGALVGELRGWSPHRPDRRESHHVAGMARLRGRGGRADSGCTTV